MKALPFASSARFLDNLDSEIETHLSDNTLTVTRLTRLIGMSRTNLHRKLERSVGMSATEYVRKKRLEKAAELLKEQPDWSICQVAMEVGFDNQGYFTRRFREVFDCPPAAFRAQREGLEQG